MVDLHASDVVLRDGSTVHLMTFFYRLMGAAKLDGGTYEQLEGDRHATPQAVIVVVLSSLAAGAGAGLRGGDLLGFLEISGLALVTWIAWAERSWCAPRPQSLSSRWCSRPA